MEKPFNEWIKSCIELVPLIATENIWIERNECVWSVRARKDPESGRPCVPIRAASESEGMDEGT